MRFFFWLSSAAHRNETATHTFRSAKPEEVLEAAYAAIAGARALMLFFFAAVTADVSSSLTKP
jgi:hypothetical protein